MTRLDEIYSELLKHYQEHHNSLVDLTERMSKLVDSGKTWEEAVLRLALEQEIQVPEIDALLDSGKSQAEAIREFSRTLATEVQVREIYTPSKSSVTHTYQPSPSYWWYLLPIFFGLIGGVVGYVGVKDANKKMANTILNLGIVLTVIDFIIGYIILVSYLRIF